MNKKIFLLATALFMTVSVIFAQDENPVPTFVRNELQKEFKPTGNVEWKILDQLYKASFTTDGTELSVFFSIDGEISAISRKLSVDQLPLVLMKEVKEKSMTHGISELFELVTDNGTEYFVVMSDEKGTKTYRSQGSSWTRY